LPELTAGITQGKGCRSRVHGHSNIWYVPAVYEEFKNIIIKDTAELKEIVNILDLNGIAKIGK
jgi:hypothetical protein